MKTKLSFLGKYLLGLCVVGIMLISGITFCSCDKFAKHDKEILATNDSVLISQYINEISNPSFLTVSEVLSFKQNQLKNKEVDSLILSMPEDILTNVVSVVIKRCGVATKTQIADEYRANRSVYENLPKAAPKTDQMSDAEETARVEDVPNTTVGTRQVNYNTKDTVIDGKRVTIETKTTQYE